MIEENQDQKDDDKKRDEVLRRMLNAPPKPRTKKEDCEGGSRRPTKR